jgi:RND family efflux transporter MFP subunit
MDLSRRAIQMALMLMLVFGAAQALADAPRRTVTAIGITQPSQKAELSFSSPGVIREIPIREGDQVAAGQTLVMQDDRMEALLLDIAKLEAESTLLIDGAEADLAAKQVALKRVQRRHEDRVATDAELEAAELEVDLAEIRVKLARQEAAQKKLQASRQEVKVELMTLTSPFEGVIERIDASVGQVADPNKPVCIVVRNDPLWVDVRDLRTSQVAQLRGGQVLEVQYEGENDWQQAKIIFISPVADATSDTQHVRLELTNPQERSSGLRMMVRVPEEQPPVADAAAAH